VNYKQDGKPYVDHRWEVKVLWASRPSYAGAILIRGAQIDDSDQIGFPIGDGRKIASALRFPPGAHRWRYFATSALVRHAGCYAFQIDTGKRSSIVVFQTVAGQSRP
jgi:hypothetical protein